MFDHLVVIGRFGSRAVILKYSLLVLMKRKGEFKSLES